MRMPFDISKRPEIEAGKYRVETRDGSPARIICWDMVAEEPIVALVTVPNSDDSGLEETCVLFDASGENQLGEPMFDKLLLVSDEPGLTEFEQAVKRTMRQYYSPGQAEDETVRQVASNLRFLARKDLEKHQPMWKRMRPDMYCEDTTISDDKTEIRLGSYYILVSDLKKLPYDE